MTNGAPTLHSLHESEKTCPVHNEALVCLSCAEHQLGKEMDFETTGGRFFGWIGSLILIAVLTLLVLFTARKLQEYWTARTSPSDTHATGSQTQTSTTESETGQTILIEPETPSSTRALPEAEANLRRLALATTKVERCNAAFELVVMYERAKDLVEQDRWLDYSESLKCPMKKAEKQ